MFNLRASSTYAVRNSRSRPPSALCSRRRQLSKTVFSERPQIILPKNPVDESTRRSRNKREQRAYVPIEKMFVARVFSFYDLRPTFAPSRILITRVRVPSSTLSSYVFRRGERVSQSKFVENARGD